MHKFNRPSLSGHLLAPIVSKKVSTWREYKERFPEEHHALSRYLWCDVQEFFCAYCERVVPLSKNGDYGAGHVEHLERIRDNPNRMGDWTNMFFSCDDPMSCGHYKDDHAGKFNLADIVDPSLEDPSAYFQYDGNGGVTAVEADPQHPHKAAETIRVFNLDQAPALRSLRKEIAITVEGFVNACGGCPSRQEKDDFLKSVQSADCPSVYRSLLC